MHFNYLRIVQIQNEDKTQRDKEALCVAPLASLSLSLKKKLFIELLSDASFIKRARNLNYGQLKH